MFRFFLFLSISLILFASEPYSHIVILGDPHISHKNISKKNEVLNTINHWNDVDSVVAIGDLCPDNGTDEEYALVKDYFSQLKKPFYPIVGNHDFFYNGFNQEGKHQKGTLLEQRQKLITFTQTFNLDNYYYSLQNNGYFLIFLATDSPEHLAHISSPQLSWLKEELHRNQTLPTIIFFHAPLNKTLEDYKHFINNPNFVAQPINSIQEILHNNPQVFLWVSGHTHTSHEEPSFAASINLYENQVTNIHNTDMNKKTIVTNSLFLYPDKVVIKTYDHSDNKWLDTLERSILSKKR